MIFGHLDKVITTYRTEHFLLSWKESNVMAVNAVVLRIFYLFRTVSRQCPSPATGTGGTYVS